MSTKVLIIEDNAQNQYLMEFLLRSIGIETICASNGKLGLAAAESEHPDLILMDIQMPEMDGYETTQHLKAQEATRDIPIIGVSSYALPINRQQAMSVGMVDYIEKPIQPERFLDQIKLLLL